MRTLQAAKSRKVCSNFTWQQSKHTHWLYLTVASCRVQWHYRIGLKHRKPSVSLAHTLSPRPPNGLVTQWKKGKKINENGSATELWMAHKHMLTNTNALLALNTERLKSQPADVISADFQFLTWLNTQHGAVVIYFVLFFFLNSNHCCTEKKTFANVFDWREMLNIDFPCNLKLPFIKQLTVNNSY